MRRLLGSALALAAAAAVAAIAAQSIPAPSRDYPLTAVMSPSAAADQSVARGAIDYVFFCAECHGANGQGNSAKGVPQLAGLHAADLTRQLTALSPSARARHAPLLKRMDHQDLVGIADYLASLAPPPAIAGQ
jgi:cytochrome c553